MPAYYNEIDPYAAQWLRNLIAAGHIAPGTVDERSIVDVRPEDLAGYTQCHFFAGIGVWSFALRNAGWPDDREVWTGSCPCQPFSAAGQGGGFDDERHLWPAFHHLIEERRPATIFGEQVASKDGLAWLDLVQADMEGSLYAFGALDLCAAGFGAPHIRQRLYWTADTTRDGRRQVGPHIERGIIGSRTQGWSTRLTGSVVLLGDDDDDDDDDERSQRHGQDGDDARGWPITAGSTRTTGATDELADDDAERRPDGTSGDQRDGHDTRWTQGSSNTQGRSSAGELADDDDERCFGRRPSEAGDGRNPSRFEPQRFHDAGELGFAHGSRSLTRQPTTETARHRGSVVAASRGNATGPTNGIWRDADWLLCRDGKWRPVEPGTFPLAHGAPSRVGRLRAYGNAIVATQAEEFIAAYLDTERVRLTGEDVFA